MILQGIMPEDFLNIFIISLNFTDLSVAEIFQVVISMVLVLLMCIRMILLY